MAKNKGSKKSAEKVTKVAPVAPVAEAKAEKVVKASKYRGVTSGMRVMEYQDHTLEINDQKDRRLTDEELQADWRREFPNAVAFTLDHVRGVRSAFNKGTHRKAQVAPPEPSRPYQIVDGKRVHGENARRAVAPKAKAKAAKAEPVAETPVIKVKTRREKKAAAA